MDTTPLVPSRLLLALVHIDDRDPDLSGGPHSQPNRVLAVVGDPNLHPFRQPRCTLGSCTCRLAGEEGIDSNPVPHH